MPPSINNARIQINAPQIEDHLGGTSTTSASQQPHDIPQTQTSLNRVHQHSSLADTLRRNWYSLVGNQTQQQVQIQPPKVGLGADVPVSEEEKIPEIEAFFQEQIKLASSHTQKVQILRDGLVEHNKFSSDVLKAVNIFVETLEKVNERFIHALKNDERNWVYGAIRTFKENEEAKLDSVKFKFESRATSKEKLVGKMSQSQFNNFFLSLYKEKKVNKKYAKAEHEYNLGKEKCQSEIDSFKIDMFNMLKKERFVASNSGRLDQLNNEALLLLTHQFKSKEDTENSAIYAFIKEVCPEYQFESGKIIRSAIDKLDKSTDPKKLGLEILMSKRVMNHAHTEILEELKQSNQHQAALEFRLDINLFNLDECKEFCAKHPNLAQIVYRKLLPERYPEGGQFPETHIYEYVAGISPEIKKKVTEFISSHLKCHANQYLIDEQAVEQLNLKFKELVDKGKPLPLALQTACAELEKIYPNKIEGIQKLSRIMNHDSIDRQFEGKEHEIKVEFGQKWLEDSVYRLNAIKDFEDEIDQVFSDSAPKIPRNWLSR